MLIPKKKTVNQIVQSREKLNNLTKISNALDYQKHLIKPGKKRKLDDKEGLFCYKFFSERKR